MSPGFVRPFCVGLVVLSFLAAAPPKDEGGTVQVSVIAIIATERDDKIDPKLACIAREVRKTHKNLTGFRMGLMTRKTVAIGGKDSFELIGDQKAYIAVKQGDDGNNRVQVKIIPPQMGEITYDTCCGKFLPVLTPFKTKDNDVLILAVRVQPCRGK
jgi:hypothetical protein